MPGIQYLQGFPRLFTQPKSILTQSASTYWWAAELTLLIFIRSSELRLARWSGIDFETSMWMNPSEREPMPGVRHSHLRTPHLVPLSKIGAGASEADNTILRGARTNFYCRS